MNRAVQTCLMTMMLLLLCTGAFAEPPLAEEWVYPDTPETTILTLLQDGTFLFEDHLYTLRTDEALSQLQPQDAELPALRCQIADDVIILYRKDEYARHPKDQSTGLPGAWLSTTGGSVFILGSDGLFMEDGLFTGSYTVDETAHAFRLCYHDDFADTVCYYTLKEDHLILEYPWKLVPKPE